MKEKFTITIADMQISVVSEASSDEVEKVADILKRRVRSILLKSQNCSKTEAIILCALDLCAEKLQIKEVLETVSSELDDEKEKNAVLEEKIALLENNLAKTEKECARLQAENKRLAFNGQVFSEHGNKNEEKPTVPEQTEQTPIENSTKRDRIGSMFDMLTFTDI